MTTTRNDARWSLARSCARRLVTYDVEEANLCHGAVGVAHIFNRVAQAAKDEKLAVMASAWYERALALAMPETFDLLEGQLGIALALSAAQSTDEPAWDRAFGISVRLGLRLSADKRNRGPDDNPAGDTT